MRFALGNGHYLVGPGEDAQDFGRRFREYAARIHDPELDDEQRWRVALAVVRTADFLGRQMPWGCWQEIEACRKIVDDSRARARAESAA